VVTSGRAQRCCLLSARLHAPEAHPMCSVETRRTSLALNHAQSTDATTFTRESIAVPGAPFFRNLCRQCMARPRAVRRECSRRLRSRRRRFAPQHYPRTLVYLRWSPDVSSARARNSSQNENAVSDKHQPHCQDIAMSRFFTRCRSQGRVKQRVRIARVTTSRGVDFAAIHSDHTPDRDFELIVARDDFDSSKRNRAYATSSSNRL
jgi:hypothetical protein